MALHSMMIGGVLIYSLTVYNSFEMFKSTIYLTMAILQLIIPHCHRVVLHNLYSP